MLAFLAEFRAGFDVIGICGAPDSIKGPNRMGVCAIINVCKRFLLGGGRMVTGLFLGVELCIVCKMCVSILASCCRFFFLFFFFLAAF